MEATYLDGLDGQEVLEEDYDENYEPTEEEVIEYCKVLGLDPTTESDLIYIAKEGIKAPLPEKWKPVSDKNGQIYYFNFSSGESTWNHPCDDFYRGLLEQEREKKKRTRSSQQGNTGHHKGLDRANPVLKGLPPLTLPSGKAPLPPLKPVATAAAVPQDHGPAKKAGPIMSMKFGPGPPPGEWTPPLKSEPPFAKSGSGALASKAGSEPLQAKSGSGPLPMKSVSGPPVLKVESRPSSAKLGSGPLQSRGGVSQTGVAVHRALSDQPLVGASDVAVSAKLTNRGLGTGVATPFTGGPGSRGFDLGVPHVSTQFEEEDEESEESEESLVFKSKFGENIRGLDSLGDLDLKDDVDEHAQERMQDDEDVSRELRELLDEDDEEEEEEEEEEEGEHVEEEGQDQEPVEKEDDEDEGEDSKRSLVNSNIEIISSNNSKKPGHVNPEKPGHVNPEKPGYVNPEKPGHVNPEKPGHVNPEKPGHVNPEKPGHVNPEKPGHVNPEKPGHVNPEKPGHVNPEKPGHVNPEKPGHVKPEKPGHVNPEKPGHVNPEKPGHVNPEKPGHVNPEKPGHVKIEKPGHVNPEKPGHLNPEKPGHINHEKNGSLLGTKEALQPLEKLLHKDLKTSDVPRLNTGLQNSQSTAVQSVPVKSVESDHSSAIEKLRDEQAKELQGLRECFEKDKVAMLAEHEAKLSSYRTELAQEQLAEEKELEKQKNTILANLKVKLREEQEDEEARLEEAKHDALRKLRQQISQSQESEERAVREEKERAVSVLQKDLAGQRASEETRLRARAERELEELRARLSGELEEEKSRVVKAHDGTVQDLREQLASERRELEARLREDHEQHKQELKLCHEKALQDLEKELEVAHKMEEGKKRCAWEETQRLALEVLQAQLGESLEAEKTELTNQHELKMLEMRAKFDEEMAGERRKLELQKQQLVSEHVGEIASMKKRHQEEMDRLTEECAAIRRDMEQKKCQQSVARHEDSTGQTTGASGHAEQEKALGSRRSCEVMEEEEEEEEEGEDGEEMEERRDLEEEGLGTEPRPLEGAVSTLRQENALLRLELGKLQQLVEEKAQIGGHRVEKEEMALHRPPSHDEGAGHLGKQGSCNGRGHSDEYAHGLQGDRDRHGGDGGGHPEHKTNHDPVSMELIAQTKEFLRRQHQALHNGQRTASKDSSTEQKRNLKHLQAIQSRLEEEATILQNIERKLNASHYVPTADDDRSASSAHSLDHEAGSQPDSLHLSDIPSPKGYLPKLRQHLEHHHRHHHKHNRMSAHHDHHDNTPKRHAGVQDGGSSDGDEEGDTTVTDDLTKPHFSKTTKKILAGKQGNEREDIVSSLLSMNRELVELLNRSAHRGAGVGVYPISGDVGMVGYPTPVGRSHTVTPRWADPVRHPDPIDQYLQPKYSTHLSAHSQTQPLQTVDSSTLRPPPMPSSKAPVSTQEMLKNQTDWLKEFQQSVPLSLSARDSHGSSRSSKTLPFHRPR